MGVGSRGNALGWGAVVLALLAVVAVVLGAGRPAPAPAQAACVGPPTATAEATSAPPRVNQPLGIVSAQAARTTDYLVVDDFDGSALRTGLWCPRYYWRGVEFGLDGRGEVNLPEQVSVHDSMLDLHAQRGETDNPNHPGQSAEVRPFRSGVVTTGMTQVEDGPARLSWQYGLLEVRATIPAGRGAQYGFWTSEQSKMWPAIWMLAADGTVNDTTSPEIDLIDVFGDSTYVQFSLQDGQLVPGDYGGPWKQERVDRPGSVLRYSGAEEWDPTNGSSPVPPRVEYGGEWHTWGLRWTPSTVEFLVDGVVHGTDTTRVPHQPYYLLINLAVGSRDGFWPPGDETPDDAHLLVDWVRLTPDPDTRIWENGVLTYGP